MKKLIYLFALISSFLWSNEATNETTSIVDVNLDLTSTDYDHVELTDTNELTFKYLHPSQQTTNTTSTGSNTGSASNTCPEAYADQPDLSFAADIEFFDFPLTELYNDPDIDNAQLAFTIGQLNPSSAGEATLNGSVVRVNFNNSDIAAGDVLTLSTSASDGECSDSFTLTILITAPSGDASNTTGGGNNTGAGNNDCTLVFNELYLDDEYGPSLTLFDVDLTNDLNSDGTVDTQDWKYNTDFNNIVSSSDSSSTLEFEILDYTDGFVEGSIGFSGGNSGNENLLSWTMSGEIGQFGILIGITDGNCEAEFILSIEVTSSPIQTGPGGGEGPSGEAVCSDLAYPDFWDNRGSNLFTQTDLLIDENGAWIDNTFDTPQYSVRVFPGIYYAPAPGEPVSYEIVATYGETIESSIGYLPATQTTPEEAYIDISWEGGASFAAENRNVDIDLRVKVNNKPECDADITWSFEWYREGATGPGDGGPGDGGGPEDDCPFIEYAIGDNALIVPLGSGEISIDLSEQIGDLGIENPCDSKVSLLIEDEYGQQNINSSFDCETKEFKFSAPENDYIAIIDIKFETPEIAATDTTPAVPPICQGVIAIDITNSLDVFANFIDSDGDSDGNAVQPDDCVDLSSGEEGPVIQYGFRNETPNGGYIADYIDDTFVEVNMYGGYFSYNKTIEIGEIADLSDGKDMTVSFSLGSIYDPDGIQGVTFDKTFAYVTLTGKEGVFRFEAVMTDSRGCKSYVVIPVTYGENVIDVGPDGNRCPQPTQGPPERYVRSWDEADTTDDLNAYFRDPDGDELIFTVEVYGFPEDILDATVSEDGILTLDFKEETAGDGFVEIFVSDGECEISTGVEFKITAPIVEGCPPIVQNEIYIPVSPVPSEIWFPIEFLFDAGSLGPLGFENLVIEDSSIANVRLGEEEGYLALFFELPTDGPEGETKIKFNVFTADGGCGEEYSVRIVSIFDEQYYEMIKSGGGPGEGGPGDGGPNDGGPGDGGPGAPEDECYGNAPYPGDDGWCGENTEIIFLENFYAYEEIVSGDQRTIDVAGEKVFSEPGVFTANVFSDNSCVATISEFAGGSVTLQFTGEPGATVVVFELRNNDLEDCRAAMAFFVDVNLAQGGGGGPGPIDTGDTATVDSFVPSNGEGCEFGDLLSPLKVDPTATLATRDLSAEIANLDLPSDTEYYIFGGSSIPLDNLGTIDENGIYSINLPGEEVFAYVAIAYHEPGNRENCYGVVDFDIEASIGDFGGGGNVGVPGTGPGAVPKDNTQNTNTAGSPGEAPYPGDDGWCDVSTEVIQLNDVITTTSEKTVTTVLSHPLLDEPGVSIANVFTNNSEIATINNFFAQNNTVILDLTGNDGGVAIVVEVRKTGESDPTKCAAVMFFILGVLDATELECEVTNEFPAIFVTPDEKKVEIDLNPFFDGFGGFKIYSQSFQLSIPDPFLSVGEAKLEGSTLKIKFAGIEGYDVLTFQNSDLEGNCINLIEVPVIVDANAVAEDSSGFGDTGLDSSDCPNYSLPNDGVVFVEIGTPEVAIDLGPALEQMPIFPEQVKIDLFTFGDPFVESGIGDDNVFRGQLPEVWDYFGIDIKYSDAETGECLAFIIADVFPLQDGGGTDQCIVSTVYAPGQVPEPEFFPTNTTETSDKLEDFFVSPSGNTLAFEVSSTSTDVISVFLNANNQIILTSTDKVGDVDLVIKAIDSTSECELILNIPFFVGDEDPNAPPDFNCVQYIDEIFPIYASNADPRKFSINLENHLFIPPTGFSASLVMPENWSETGFVDIRLDGPFIRIKTDERFGAANFQITYSDGPAASANSTCEPGTIDLFIEVNDDLAAFEAEFQELCGDTSSFLNTDHPATVIELGSREETKVDLSKYLLDKGANVDFYVRYDLLFPPGTFDDPNFVPFIDGWVSGPNVNAGGGRELIVFAPRFEPGQGVIPVAVYDMDTGCEYFFDVPIDVQDNLGISDIECPKTIIDFADFNINQGVPIEIAISDFFDLTSDVEVEFEFGSEMGKVDIELSANVDGPLLLITPKEGVDNLGDEFIFLFASDINKYCEAFSNIFLRILPEGIADLSENSCPEPTDLFQYEYIWPETQDFLSLNVNDYFIDPDGEQLEIYIFIEDNPQIDYTYRDGILDIYLKEFKFGKVPIFIDAVDNLGCMVHEVAEIQFGEKSADQAFNRCPEITEQGQANLDAILASQGVVEDIIASDVEYFSVALSDVFTDRDGDEIIYQAFSLNPAIATAEVVSNTLIIYFLPNQYEKADFELIATDGDPYCDSSYPFSITRTPPANAVAVVVCPEVTAQIPPIQVIQGSELKSIPLANLFADVSSSSFNFFAASENNEIAVASLKRDKLIIEFSSTSAGNTIINVASSNVSGTCSADLSFAVTVFEKPADEVTVVNLAPEFEVQSASIKENDGGEVALDIKRFVSEIKVTDPEGSNIDLSIIGGNEAGNFELSLDVSGTTYIINQIGIVDFETKPEYVLKLSANDGDKATEYDFKINVENIKNAFTNADFDFKVYDQDQATETASASSTSGRIAKNESYKRFTNPRHSRQMNVGKWKVRKKITGGQDSDLFTIKSVDSGDDQQFRGGMSTIEDVIVFKNPPDFENPQDHNRDNIYEVEVQLINVDDGGSEIPILVNQTEITVPENDTNTIEIQSIGATPSQDTDGDGVPDVIDNSPLYANADQSDADGDGVGDVTDDDDQDGVWNPNDGCPTTTLGNRVDFFGCSIFYLPPNNFSITKSEKCIGTNSISISAVRDDLTYSVTVSGTISKTETFTGSEYKFENLSAGNYSVCLTVVGQDASVYERCYTMNIAEPQALDVFSMADAGNNVVTFNLSGGTIYNIVHNGITTQTDKESYTVSLDPGMNEISIGTGIECQGYFEASYFNSSPVDLAPNPFNSSLNLFVGGQDETVTVSVFNMAGARVLTMEKELGFSSRDIELNTTSLMGGTYIIKINGATTKQSFVAIKQ